MDSVAKEGRSHKMKTVMHRTTVRRSFGCQNNWSFPLCNTLPLKECMVLLFWVWLCVLVQVKVAKSQRKLSPSIPATVGQGNSAITRQAKAHSASRSSKATQWPIPQIVSSAGAKKFLKRIKANGQIRRTANFAEVEILLSTQFNLAHIAALPKAPGSDLNFLDSPKRVRVQLPISQVKALINEGADIIVLRKFILIEGVVDEAGALDDTATQGNWLSTFCYGENSNNAYIPNDGSGWGYSFIHISCAPIDATVTSLDVHYEIIHEYVGDLIVELTDEDYLTYTYRLWEDPYNSGSSIIETEIGITAFNGKFVNQTWLLWALDTFPFFYEGYIDYWWIKVYYEDGGPEEQYNIQADSYQENTIDVPFAFYSNPGRVYFSTSPACGSLDPGYDDPIFDPWSAYWWVDANYTPCEAECTSVTITADPTYGSEQTKTIHLDERYHIGCGARHELGVSTWDPDTNEPAQTEVNVTVIPPEAGTVSPSYGLSQYDPDYGLYIFWSTYTPSCSYAGRVRVRFHTANSTVIYSFDQNNETLIPSACWQMASESFCTQGWHSNYYQVYKIYLYAGQSYDFSLCDDDGVGASCDGNGDLMMFDSSGTPLWYSDGASRCDWDASTLGTDYENWSPTLDGYYYLHVSNFDVEPMSYTLAYRGSAGDFDHNGTVNFADFAFLVNHWMNMCSRPDWCECSDLDWSGAVNLIDLGKLVEYWLEDTIP